MPEPAGRRNECSAICPANAQESLILQDSLVLVRGLCKSLLLVWLGNDRRCALPPAGKPALNVFIVNSVLKYGGVRCWAVVLVWWYRVVTLINRQCPRRSTGQRCETWRETDIRNGRELETMAGKKF